MNVGKINNKTHKKRILIAPLDWGLGHATRCIPIIRLLIQHGAEVIVAAENPVAALLQKEFPTLVILRLRGYKISYSNSKMLFLLKMLLQVPRVTRIIKYEKNWLDQAIIQYNIDAVISDNRFGLYTNKIPCVFITHQLFIETGNSSLNRLSQKINYKYINKFTECWAPDKAGSNNLAGKLSHPDKLPAPPLRYIGLLSRFTKTGQQKDIDLLVMVSGPEPQRSIFENILLPQLKDINGRIVLLRGLPAANDPLILENKNVTVFNHLPAEALNNHIERSTLVIARSGYSTIMDLAVLKQKAILIPTPGQTEQEYLAEYIKEKKIFFTTKQEHFSLKQEMRNVKDFEFADAGSIQVMDEKIILEWLGKLTTG